MRLATVSVTGKDQPGIIAKTTFCLYRNEANIISLDEKVVNKIFSMTLNADLRDADLRKIKRGLAKVAQELDLEIKINLHDTQEKKNLAILVSKEDHCLKELVRQCKSGKIHARPVVVIGNHPTLAKLSKTFKLPFELTPEKNKEEREQKTIKLLKHYNADFIALARHMQILSPEFVARYEGRIINIHPSLLPAFPGARPYHQALEAGVEIVGVTAHFVTTDLDRGPVITQDAFRASKKDTVEKIRSKGQRLESKVLARACELYSKDRLYMQWGKVHFK